MRWGYKTVHFSLKKEGLLGSAFLDEAEIEVSLNEFGKAGWELISLMEVNDGLIGVFKQPFSEGISPMEEEDERVVQDSIEAVSQKNELLVEENRKSTHGEMDAEDVGSIKIL